MGLGGVSSMFERGIPMNAHRPADVNWSPDATVVFPQGAVYSQVTAPLPGGSAPPGVRSMFPGGTVALAGAAPAVGPSVSVGAASRARGLLVVAAVLVVLGLACLAGVATASALGSGSDGEPTASARSEHRRSSGSEAADRTDDRDLGLDGDRGRNAVPVPGSLSDGGDDDVVIDDREVDGVGVPSVPGVPEAVEGLRGVGFDGLGLGGGDVEVFASVPEGFPEVLAPPVDAEVLAGVRTTVAGRATVGAAYEVPVDVATALADVRAQLEVAGYVTSEVGGTVAGQAGSDIAVATTVDTDGDGCAEVVVVVTI